MPNHPVALACFVAVIASAGLLLAASPQRTIPAPLGDHPGNVFLAGEELAVPVAAKDGEAWEAVDYDGKRVAEGKVAGGRAALGKLPVGWYEVRAGGEAVSAGVLAPLKAPTPVTSPISLDVAMAWFYKTEPQMKAVANLCTLAGINWVRDRLAWGEMEPERGKFSGPNRYDASARIQSEAGLRVLQVSHISPPWANPNGKRFPPDLRDAYRFYREMAKRWAGQVTAYEPWNEADIDVFGGHTGAEMAALQKASYLGLKAGRPDVIACQNVFATAQGPILKDLDANAAWPYFDKFNLHHYCGTDGYPGVYAAFRAVSGGRPMWVTEFAVPVPWAGDEKKKEPTAADLKIQSERIAQVYAASLAEGPEESFYFILGHYVEGQTQFGLIRLDLTPRPGYLALAAIGRLLADARPLGSVKKDNVRAHVFSAKPDGEAREVLVAWAQGGGAEFKLPVAPEAVYDHLGRPAQAAGEALKLTAAPVFAVLPMGTSAKMNLVSAPIAPPVAKGEPSPVVLQALWPEAPRDLGRSAYRISGEKPEKIPVYIYNFSDKDTEGTLKVEAPQGWKCEIPAQAKVAGSGPIPIQAMSKDIGPVQGTMNWPAGERVELALTLDATGAATAEVQTIRVTGDFGAAGKPVLSLQVIPQINFLKGAIEKAVPGADKAERWSRDASAGSEIKVEADGKAIVVTARLGGGDRWVFPKLALGDGEWLPADLGALRATITLLEGEATFRTVFTEENGAGYVVDFVPPPEKGKAVECAAVLSEAHYGEGWSKPDPNGRLDADQVRTVAVGCNPKSETVKFRMENLRWVRRKP